jgi:hypothetical protein
MDGPRDPETKEEQLPDALDQVPAGHEGAEHGSEDAQLLAKVVGDEAEAGEDGVLDEG